MNERNATFRLCAFAVLAFAAAACGGGGRTSAPVPRMSGSVPATSTSVRVALLIPKRPVSARRGRTYVSYNTQSAQVSIGGKSAVVFSTTEGSPDCITDGAEVGTTCSASVDAPVGTDTFTLSLYSGSVTSAGAVSGDLLSTGTAAQNIVAGTANTVNLTLDGVVSSISLIPASAPAGTATTVPIFVSAKDSSGATIVGPGVYIDATGNPVTITLKDSDAASTTNLVSGTTSLTDPTQNAQLHYSGAQPHGVLPFLTASVSSLGLTSTLPFGIVPVLKLISSAFTTAPEAMTLGGDGDAYLLESPPGANPFNPIVAQVPLSGAGAGTPQEHTYLVQCEGASTVSALAPAIATDPSDGSVYFSDAPECTYGTELVRLDANGFTGYPLNDPAYDNIGVTSALTFPASGTAFLVSDVESNPQIAARRHSRRRATAPLITASSSPSPSPSPNPSGSPSAPPQYSAYGTSVVTSTTNGSATDDYTLESSLGLPVTDSYTFSGVPNANVITVDGAGNSWFPETITDTTTNTTHSVLIKANASGATAYPLPMVSGTSNQITALTYASDGNFWYVDDEISTGSVSYSVSVTGMFSPANGFTQQGFEELQPPLATSTAIVEGADKALYTALGGKLVRIAEADGSVEGFTAPPAVTAFAAGIKTASNDIYFAGPSLYQMLY